MKRFLVFLVLFGLVGALGAGSAHGESEELRPLVARPAAVTEADNRATVVLTVGDMLLVRLGNSPYTWEVAVTGEAELTRVIDALIPPNAQGLWEAKTPGPAVIEATGYLPCHRQPPMCKAAYGRFEVQVMVQPQHQASGEFRIGTGDTFLENSRTYVPAAALAAALRAEFTDADGKTARLRAGGPAVTLHAGSRQLTIGEATVQMDVAPVLRDGVLYLPMRWVAEALGYRVGWDGAAWKATFSGE